MKIGEFAKQNNTSIDTIRHYMDMGLIVAQKNGAQYNFDEQCNKSLEDIINLKSMGFSLNDIKTIFLFRSLGRLTNYQEMEYFSALYDSKHTQITEQINELSVMRDKLGKEMESLSKNKSTKNYKMGVDVFALPLLRCKKCNGSLQITDGAINDNQIMSGVLKCDCGQQYQIVDGIIFTDDKFAAQKDFTAEYIVDYIQETDSKYLDNIYKGIHSFNSALDVSTLKGKVILELGSGIGFLLRNIYASLPDSCTYFAVDHDINRHIFLKNMLESADTKKNIVFICGDFLDMPLAKKSVDAIFDFSGTSNYSFYSDAFLLNEVDNFTRDKSILLGSYIAFNNFSVNSIIEDSLKPNFVLKNIKQHIQNLGYVPTFEKTSDYLSAGGKYEDYFVDGEKVFTYLFCGKR